MLAGVLASAKIGSNGPNGVAVVGMRVRGAAGPDAATVSRLRTLARWARTRGVLPPSGAFAAPLHTRLLPNVLVAIAYFALAKFGLALASLHPSASPIWPPSGLALAAVLIWGSGVWPALFLGAFLANATTFGTVSTSLAIAGGNTLEALVTAGLLQRWSGGPVNFETPARVAKFAAFALAPGTIISATVGVGSLVLAGQAEAAKFAGIWMTWWLGDVGGQLLIAPLIVLWARSGKPAREEWPGLSRLMLGTLAVGLIAFSPAAQWMAIRGPLAFLAIAPMLWAALRFQPRDTATAALVLSCFAIGGTLSDGGPFARQSLNDSFLLVLSFIISTTVPSLILSAEVGVRRRSEQRVREAHAEVDRKVQVRTAELAQANVALLAEVEHRRVAEAEGDRHRRQLEGAQRLANLGSWSWDVRTGKVTWSAQLYRIYGVEPGSFNGTFEDFLSRIHPDDRSRVRAEVTAAFAAGRGFQLEERILRPSGEMRELQSSGETIKDETGKPVQMIGICQDVTERRQGDVALKQSLQRYQLVVDGIRDHAIYMLDPAGNVASWNTGAARIKRYAAEEILGRSFAAFYTEEDRARGLPGKAMAIAAREGKYEAEGWRVRKDGSRFWASVVLDALRDETGKLAGFVKITRDITERRNAQLALDAARDQLAQSQKMEALGQLTGGIAHDFNNVLAALLANLTLMRRRTGASSASSELIDNSLAALERASTLTQRMLAFARRQDLKPSQVDVARLVEGMTDLLKRTLGPQIVIDTRLPRGPVAALVDANQLELAIMNLALNARDAMPAGGRLTLAVERQDVGTTTSQLGAGAYVRIGVRDTGIGMDEATLARAAEPFFTTKGVGKGTGLGLSMAQGLAEQSGGRLELASRSGEGTTAAIWLPASEQPAAKVHAARPATANNGNSSRSVRVLVVDDDPLVLMGTVGMLEDMGHAVVQATSGKAALSILEANREIDVLVTDQAMPGMTGTELVTKARAARAGLPAIITTGYASFEGMDRALPILRKPYLPEALAKAISEVMRA
jgi:PAS domain S-box-containing protein